MGSAIPEWGIYSIAGASVTATTGAASAVTALPTASDGATARFVRIKSTGPAWIKPGQSTTTAAANTAMLIDASTELVLNVRGCSHLAHIQQTGAQSVNITPLEV